MTKYLFYVTYKTDRGVVVITTERESGYSREDAAERLAVYIASLGHELLSATP